MSAVNCLFLSTILLSLSACSPASNGSASITVNLAEAVDAKRDECATAFRSGDDTKYAGADGATWISVKGADGTLSHYCRKHRDGAISAWNEASSKYPATHRLKFDSNNSPAVFQAI